MPSKLTGALIGKAKHPFHPRGYTRNLLYERMQKNGEATGRTTTLRQVLTPPSAKVGQINIYQGENIAASLFFRLGKDIPSRLKEIKSKDAYVDIGNLDQALIVSRDNRGGRLAHQLLTELIHYTKKTTGGDVYLRVELTNEKALGLYTSMGFKQVRMVNGEMLMVHKANQRPVL